MEMEYGKLFIGGISWDTNEEGLKEYFQTFGEVIEAIIMKDRITGRARGFGFVVFSDPAVAERVVKEKHIIDGRTVEAKKAVPRDDQQIINRSSPGPIRTKKIFVGGLASSVTENDFKNYFNQYGMITDVVVMYDHITNRPRGFGFITYESEESVDKALIQTFHELNGKMVEVKRAVPKEGFNGSVRSQLSGFNNGLSRGGSLVNYGLSQGYNSKRFRPGSAGRSGYDMGLGFDLGLGMDYGGNGGYRSDIGYTRVGLNRFADPFGYGLSGGGGGNGSVLKSTNYNMWANGGQNLSNIWGSFSGGQSGGVGGGSGSFIAGNINYGGEESTFGYRSNGNSMFGEVGGGGFGGGGGFSGGSGGGGFRGGSGGGGIGGGDAIFIDGQESAFGYSRSNGNSIFGEVGGGSGSGGGSSSGNGGGGGSFSGGDGGGFSGGNNGGGGGSGIDGGGGCGSDDGDGDLFYAGPTWRASSPKLELSDLFGYNFGTGSTDDIPKKSVGYVGYNVIHRPNRGIAA